MPSVDPSFGGRMKRCGVVAILLCCASPAAAADEPKASAAAAASVARTDLARCQAWIGTRHSGYAPAVHRVGPVTICVDTNSVGLTAELVGSFTRGIASISRRYTPQIVIRSLGGDVRYGIAMGRIVTDRKATVFVSTFCGSSCANYLFLPAHRREVLRDGLVIFHGGINARSLDDRAVAQSGASGGDRQRAKVRVRVQDDLRQQAELLARSGVDRGIFDWMDRINDDPALVTAKCPTKQVVKLIVLSDAVLASMGAPVAVNDGPKSQADLDRVIRPYGLAETTCFWT